MTDAKPEIRQTTVPGPGPFGLPVNACDGCGCVVYDVAAHIRWHERTEPE